MVILTHCRYLDVQEKSEDLYEDNEGDF